MKRVTFVFKFIIAAMLPLLFFSCNQARRVVPYEVDTDEIFKPLEPNEDSSPENLVFGSNGVPGVTLDYDFTSTNDDIYINLENLTILDVNPNINQTIFGFVKGMLAEYGFIPENATLAENEFESLSKQGFSYLAITDSIMNQTKREFDSQLKELEDLGTPFNASFKIYPVYLKDTFVTYRLTAYCYTGGAHGMTVTYLSTFDLQSGKLLSPEDIIKPEALEDVREEVAAHMAYSYPIYENIETVEEYIDSLNVWLDVSPDGNDNDTHKITLQNYPLSDAGVLESGLAFVYQMYEITPGSDGCPIVLIPYKDLKGCLQPQFAQ